MCKMCSESELGLVYLIRTDAIIIWEDYNNWPSGCCCIVIGQETSEGRCAICVADILHDKIAGIVTNTELWAGLSGLSPSQAETCQPTHYKSGLH